MTILVQHYPWKRTPVWLIRVDRWRPGYRHFNLVFARTWLPCEMMILDKDFLCLGSKSLPSKRIW